MGGDHYFTLTKKIPCNIMNDGEIPNDTQTILFEFWHTLKCRPEPRPGSRPSEKVDRGPLQKAD